jgi:hypothetical protein
MPVLRLKSPQMSPVYEKLQIERLQKCIHTADAAKEAVERSKKLRDQTKRLINRSVAKKGQAS